VNELQPSVEAPAAVLPPKLRGWLHAGDGGHAGVQPAAQLRRHHGGGGLDGGLELVHYATVTYATVGCRIQA